MIESPIHIILSSKVKSNPRNVAHDFETLLPHELELAPQVAGWEASLNMLAYPPEWNVVGKQIMLAACLMEGTGLDHVFCINDLEGYAVDYIKNYYSRNPSKIKTLRLCTCDFLTAQHFAQKLQTYIQTEIDKEFTLSFNKQTNRFETQFPKPSSSILIFTFLNDRLFDILGMSQCKNTDTVVGINVMLLDDKMIADSEPLWTIPDNTLLIHCDFVENSLVGDKQYPILAQIPLNKNSNIWKCNQPYYVKLKLNKLSSIRIWVTNGNNEPLKCEESEEPAIYHITLRPNPRPITI